MKKFVVAAVSVAVLGSAVFASQVMAKPPTTDPDGACAKPPTTDPDGIFAKPPTTDPDGIYIV